MGYVEKGLVDRKHFDIGGHGIERVHDGSRHHHIALRPRRDLDEFGAELQRLFDPHAGFNPAGAGLIGTGDDAGALQPVGDADRPPPQLGPVELLDGREECVHINVNNGLGPWGMA